MHPLPWADREKLPLVSIAYRRRILDQRVLSYRSTFLVSVHPSFFEKKDLQSASMTMSGDHGRSQRYSDFGPKTAVRVRP